MSAKRKTLLLVAISLTVIGCSQSSFDGSSEAKGGTKPPSPQTGKVVEKQQESGSTQSSDQQGQPKSDRGYTLTPAPAKLTEADASTVCGLAQSDKVEAVSVTGSGNAVSDSITKASVIRVTGASNKVNVAVVGNDQESVVDAVCISVVGAANTINYQSTVSTNNLFINITGAKSVVAVNIPKGAKIGRAYINVVGASSEVSMVGEGEYKCADFTLVGAASKVTCGNK